MITTPRIDEFENRFRYHAPSEAKALIHADLRAVCEALATYFKDQLPNGREKSTAITKVEEAMFWANAAVARND